MYSLILSTKRLENVRYRLRDTGVHRSVAQGILAGLGLTQFLHEIEKIGDAIRLEGDDELLIIQTKGIGGVEPHAGILEADADMLVHHALAIFQRQRVPGACLHKWVDEEILLVL